MRTRTLIAAAALAATMLLAACSDDASTADGGADTTTAVADGAAPADTGTITGDTTTGDTASGDTITGDTTTGDATTGDTASGAPTGPGKDTEFCKYQQELNDMTTPFDNPESGAAEFEQYFKEMVTPAIDKLEQLAPDEIKDQMVVLADGLRQFATAFEKNGWDPQKAYADEALKALAANEAYNQAGTAVDQYCGF